MSRSAPFLGMRGTGDWAADERPENWRETILFLFPNGSSPITGLSSKLDSQVTDDVDFHWWTQRLPEQGGTLQGSGLYTDAALATALASNTVAAGTTLYAKMTNVVTAGIANVNEFGVGKTVALRYSGDPTVDTVALVQEVVENGTSSYIKVKTLEASAVNDNGYGLTDADECHIAGSAFPQGSYPPDAINYVPTKISNKTEIYKNTIDLSRTALKTRYRTSKNPKEAARRFELMMHGMELEKSFIRGQVSETTGENNKPVTTSRGFIKTIQEYASANILNFELDSNYSESSWIESGEDFLQNAFEQLVRYGAEETQNERVIYCGNGFLMGIERLARAYGNIQMKGQDLVYGMKVMTWMNSFGVFHFKTHPLLNQHASMRNSGLVTYPSYNLFRPLVDSDTNREDVTPSGYDGTKEQWLTEGGWEIHHPETQGIIHGVGLDNAV